MTESVASAIDEHQYIHGVEYGAEILPDLFQITNTGRIAGTIVIGALLFTAMFLISNTIKLTIVARKKEIQIMKLVARLMALYAGRFLLRVCCLVCWEVLSRFC